MPRFVGGIVCFSSCFPISEILRSMNDQISMLDDQHRLSQQSVEVSVRVVWFCWRAYLRATSDDVISWNRAAYCMFSLIECISYQKSS
jgi:hypothetical protein